MNFFWDQEKEKNNSQKHGISFVFAQRVFDDPYALSWLDHRFSIPEERWLTLGYVGNLLIIVAHTYRSNENAETIRIISARKATKKEQEIYYKYYAKNSHH